MVFQTIFFLFFALFSIFNQSYAASDKIICFYVGSAVYRSDDGCFKPEHVDINLCTHIYYAFLGVNSNGTLKVSDDWEITNLGSLTKTKLLKNSENQDLKLLISVGGYDAGNIILTDIAATPSLTANFVSSCVSFFDEWGYDGIDIHWQYPVDDDKDNFVYLLKEMKSAFDNKGYLLSVTLANIPRTSYDVPEISRVADLINVMSYGFYNSYQGVTGLNSPLYGPKSVNNSVVAWLNAGADPSKLTLGISFYANSYTLIEETRNGLGAAATVGIKGPYTNTSGVLGFNEICQFFNSWTKVWNKQTQVSYSYNGSNWISYEDENSTDLKVKYAKGQGLAGIMVWSIDSDDFRGACGTQYALLKAIKTSLFDSM